MRPHLIKIVKNDVLLQLLMLVPIVFFGMFIVTNVFGVSARRGNISLNPSDFPVSLFLAVGSAIIVAGILIWRVSAVRGVFSRGKEIAGTITNLNINQASIGKIYCSYVFDNTEYQGRIEIVERFVDKKILKALFIGKEIQLIVNPSNPKQIFMKELYL